MAEQLSEHVRFSGGQLTQLAGGFPGLQSRWDARLREQAARDLALVAERAPEIADLTVASPVSSDADVEDFWENLARTAAAIRAADHVGAEFTVVPPNAEHPDWNDYELSERLGPVLSAEENRHGSDPLVMHQMLIDHGGRWMRLAGYGDEPGELPTDEDVVELALQRAKAGVQALVVKLVGRKTGIIRIDLRTDITAPEIHERLLAYDENFGWVFIRIAGRRHTLLVQDWIPMVDEYRLFVVDGKIVSGAGCIEEFTPYDRADPDDRFDIRLRRHRGNAVTGQRSEGLHIDSTVVERYLRFAAPIAAAHGGTLVIDVATTTDNKPVIIELNPLPNSGLYASNPDAVYRRLVRARDRGYGVYPLMRDAPKLLEFARPINGFDDTEPEPERKDTRS